MITKITRVKKIEIKQDGSATYMGQPIYSWIEVELTELIPALALDPDEHKEFIKKLGIAKAIKITLEVVE